jgi:hypothetical protein
MTLKRKLQLQSVGAQDYMTKTEKLNTNKLVPSYDRKRLFSGADVDWLLVLTSRQLRYLSDLLKYDLSPLSMLHDI